MSVDYDWLENEIRDGMAHLLTIGSLDRTPPRDAIEYTAREWVATLTFERSWDCDRDTPRVRAAFLRLGRDSLRWPTPRDFLIALPATAQQRLPKPQGPREPTPHALKCMAEISEMFADVDGWAIRSQPYYHATRAFLPRRPAPNHYDARAAAAGAHLEREEEEPAATDDPALPEWLQERNDPKPRDQP
jgi:hypothetical protein